MVDSGMMNANLLVSLAKLQLPSREGLYEFRSRVPAASCAGPDHRGRTWESVLELYPEANKDG